MFMTGVKTDASSNATTIDPTPAAAVSTGRPATTVAPTTSFSTLLQENEDRSQWFLKATPKAGK